MNTQWRSLTRLNNNLYTFGYPYSSLAVAVRVGLATAMLYPGMAAAISIGGPDDLPGALPTIVSGNAVQEDVARVIGVVCPTLDEGNEERRDLKVLCDDVVVSALDSELGGRQQEEEAAAAIAQASPEQVSAQGTAELRTAVVQYANIESRLAALRAGAGGVSLAGLSLSHDGQLIAGRDLELLLPQQLRGGGAAADGFSRLGIFISGAYGSGEQKDTSREAGFDFDTYGITVGVDYRFTDSFVFGGAFGYNDVQGDFNNSRGKLDTDGYSLMLYGTFYPNDAFYVDFLGFYGENSYKTRRHILYSYSEPVTADDHQTIDAILKSENDSQRYGLSLGAGYAFSSGAWSTQPFGELGYSKTDFDGFTESADNIPGQGWALHVGDSEVETLTSSLGVQLSRAFSQSWGVLLPQARAAWMHEFLDDSRKITARFVQADGFVNDPNAAIQITTDDPDRDYGNLGLGLSATFAGGASAFFFVETIVAHKYVDQYNLSLGFRKEL